MFVKICGLTREEDARAAVECGAAAVGFIFWRGSPRFVDPARAGAIVRTLPPFVTPVGVFVNEGPTTMNAIADEVGLGAVQLHGDETTEAAAAVRRPIVKALGGTALGQAGDWPDRIMLLVDADDRSRRGGTGARADWTGAARLAGTRRILLAGGITAENVAEALQAVRPFGIDVSSGVESAPGIKDHRRMRQLFEAVRAVAPR
jgi:phosphoribosylanthranilate isomerase